MEILSGIFLMVFFGGIMFLLGRMAQPIDCNKAHKMRKEKEDHEHMFLPSEVADLRATPKCVYCDKALHECSLNEPTSDI